jgi:predicted DNA-binding transcriptional regulator AlpA
MTAPQKRLVPIPEARHVLGDIGNTTIYDLIKRKKLTKVNIGRRGFVTSESLNAFLDDLTEGDGAA